MTQGALPYKYEEEKTDAGLTALAGLPVYLDLASVLGLGDHIRAHMHVKVRGWTDEQIVASLALLNIAGGGRRHKDSPEGRGLLQGPRQGGNKRARA